MESSNNNNRNITTTTTTTTTTTKEELELLLSTCLFYSNCYDIRYQFSGGGGNRSLQQGSSHEAISFPNILQYFPKTSTEWYIHFFNIKQLNFLNNNTSDGVLEWILATSKQLNPRNLVHYLTETEERLDLLLLLAQRIIERNKDNYIECLRDYLLSTGGIILINQPINDEMKLKLQKVLEIFSSALLIVNPSTQSNINNHFQILYELSQCILALNQAILTGQESYSLPLFFDTIRKITSHKLQIFSARELSSLYNTLRTNGPYVLPPPPSPQQMKDKFYLLSSPLFITTGYVLFNHPNTSRSLKALTENPSNIKNISIYQKREIYLTSHALYLSTPPHNSDPTPSNSNSNSTTSPPPPSSPSTLECIPLESLQFLRSERDDSICELHPLGRLHCLCVEYHCPGQLEMRENEQPAPQIFVSCYQNIFMRFTSSSSSSSELYFRQLDDCIWKIRCDGIA